MPFAPSLSPAELAALAGAGAAAVAQGARDSIAALATTVQNAIAGDAGTRLLEASRALVWATALQAWSDHFELGRASRSGSHSQLSNSRLL